MSRAEIYTFLSVVEGNGAKYCATNFAYEIRKKQPKAKIALVDFDFYHPYLCALQTARDQFHGIDNLLDKIGSGTLNEMLFRENMIKIEGCFDVLKGTRKIGRENLILREHILQSLEYLKELYDYVLVVVSSRNDNAGTIYGLNQTDKVIIVLRNNYANLYNFEKTVEICKKFVSKSDIPIYTIYNMTNEKDAYDSFTKIINENKLQPLGALEYEPKTVDNANIGTQAINLGKAGAITEKIFSKQAPKNTKTIENAVGVLLQLNEKE